MKVKCEIPNCPNVFEKIVPWKRFCSPKCKQMGWALKEANKVMKPRRRKIKK